MARPALHIEVSAKDRKVLHKLVSGGVQQVRVVLRALSLLRLAEGVSAPRIARMIPLTPQAIRKVGHRYESGGLERALYEKPRPGAAEVLDDSQKQHVIARVIGISPGNTKASTTAYDPTCGSGSLLLKVAAQAGKHITLEGQEKDVTTAGLVL